MGNDNPSNEVYKNFDGLSSPYSMKLHAVLRYRRIPHVWTQVNDRNAYEIANVRPPVIPVFAISRRNSENRQRGVNL
ncbi:MAG: hypothetical protein Q7S99_14110 [Parvibaculum sp.]|nr:hypothetical protein [Parvibaculum sp.]|tara:strand:- start:359 stop:589 length:231 start_codon:yes stop_codon:yes gene_type:complete